MQTLSQIKEYVSEQGVRPKKALGQNFLHDHNQLQKLIDASGICAGELVLEVGPGTGTLTEALLERGAEVVACELDRDMVSILERHVAPSAGERLRLIRGDALASKRSLNPEVVQALDRPFRLVANLPYQITSPLVIVLIVDHMRPPAKATSSIERLNPCDGIYITVQKEVAERILSGPGSKEYGPLGVIAQAFASPRLIATLPPGCFWPPPKVTSAMIAIEPSASALVVEDRRAVADALQFIFQKRRKQLGAALGRDVAWPEGVRPEQRPEEVEPFRLIELAQRIGSR